MNALFRFSFYSLIGLLLLPPTGFGAPEAERVKRVEASSGAVVQFPVLAVHPTARKLYATQHGILNPQETGLWVFDIDKLGDLTSSDERVLPMLPSLEKPNTPAYCSCIRFSPDGRKLYMAVNGNECQKTLVVQDLDEKGEPHGKPRVFLCGNPYFSLWDILPHPKANILYSVGWGGAGVFATPLTRGEPSGEPVPYPVGGHGKISIVANDTWDTLFLGTYPSVVETVSVSGDGEVEKPLPGDVNRVLKGATSQIYLRVLRLGHNLVFPAENTLFTWPLDKNWQPVGKPLRHPEIRTDLEAAGGVLSVAGDQLYVVHYEVVADEASKKPVSKGFRILAFKPDDKGGLGKPIFESQLFEKAACASMAVDEKSGVIYVSY